MKSYKVYCISFMTLKKHASVIDCIQLKNKTFLKIAGYCHQKTKTFPMFVMKFDGVKNVLKDYIVDEELKPLSFSFHFASKQQRILLKTPGVAFTKHTYIL